MDYKANIREQKSLARDILRVQDECPDSGEFTPAQTNDIVHDALRLAELVDCSDGEYRGLGSAEYLAQIAQQKNEACRITIFLAVDALSKTIGKADATALIQNVVEAVTSSVEANRLADSAALREED
jgi:hypothetical protein